MTNVPTSSASWPELVLAQKKAMLEHWGEATSKNLKPYPNTQVSDADSISDFWQDVVGGRENALGVEVRATLEKAYRKILSRHGSTVGYTWSGLASTHLVHLGETIKENYLDGPDTIAFWDGLQSMANEYAAVESFDPSKLDFAWTSLGEAWEEAPEKFGEWVSDVGNWTGRLASNTIGGAVSGIVRGAFSNPVTAVLLVVGIGVGGFYLYTRYAK